MSRDAEQMLADLKAVAEMLAPKVLLCPPALEDAARELVAHYGLDNVEVQADRDGILPDGTAALMRRPAVVRPWVGADTDERDYLDPDPHRHDAYAQWPEVVDGRCVICQRPVAPDEIDCGECFIREDTAARRREDAA